MTEDNCAPIRPRHILKVVKWIVLAATGMATWFAGAIIPADYLGGAWAVGYVLASVLTPFVLIIAKMEATGEAKTDKGEQI